MGYEYQSDGELGFLSKKLTVLKKAIGNTVWVVQGIRDGRKTAYTLCGAYIASSISRQSASSDMHVIRGKPITEFNPPVPLNELSWFPAFLKSQSNFSLGFSRIGDESLIQSLTALRSESTEPTSLQQFPDIDLLAAATEGESRLVSHLRRERNRALIDAKKAATSRSKGTLACEACGFDFSIAYGTLGAGFCEVHHLKPLSSSKQATTTTLDDLAVLCSNCHRIIHRSDPMPSVAELSEIIRNGRPQKHAPLGRAGSTAPCSSTAAARRWA
jgi:HNH endonuclease